MITNYLPYIFGLPIFLFGLYLFLISFKIYRPKHKTEKQKEKFDTWLIKYGTLTKVASIIMILNGGYDLVINNPDKYKVTSNQTVRQWETGDREILINNCIRDSKTTGENYPTITKEYCECSMDKIMKAMTFKEYESSLSKPIEQQKKEIIPLFTDCLTRLRQRIDSVDNKMR